jgi:serine protease Do
MQMHQMLWRRALAILLLTTLAAGAAIAQPEVDQSRRNAIVKAIEKAAPAVVSVNVVVQQRPDPFGPGFWEYFYNPSPRYQRLESIGSGFLFDEKGHVMTNYHVIEGADHVDSITLPDGRQLKAEFIGGDRRSDIAILRVRGSELPHLKVGRSADLIIGEWAIAIGNPFGALIEDPEPSVSVGVVSAVQRRLSPSIGSGQRLYQRMIQTDAAINPGNSGGPLVNANGEVIGVNTMIFTPSGGNIGLGFAIPIERAKQVADEIIEYGRRRDPWPGFRVQDMDNLRTGPLAPPETRRLAGCLVVNILRSSPAYEAGLRPGDVIVEVNEQPTPTATDLDFAIWSLFVGDEMELRAVRGGQELSFSFPVVEVSGR